jgi:hypothetical protein
MTIKEVRQMLDDHAVVPLWPETGNALNLSRFSTYEGAKRGDIRVIEVGRLKRVPTSWLREKLGLNDEQALLLAKRPKQKKVKPPAPTPAPKEKKKRIGLADLKKAALARRA